MELTFNINKSHGIQIQWYSVTMVFRYNGIQIQWYSDVWVSEVLLSNPVYHWKVDFLSFSNPYFFIVQLRFWNIYNSLCFFQGFWFNMEPRLINNKKQLNLNWFMMNHFSILLVVQVQESSNSTTYILNFKLSEPTYTFSWQNILCKETASIISNKSLLAKMAMFDLPLKVLPD